jgi:hypothetical protein
MSKWLSWAVTILFAVLFTYPLWVGVSNMVSYPQTLRAHYLGISPIGWVLLSLSVLTAPIAFLCCLLLARHRGTILLVLIYITGLCVVCAALASLAAISQFAFFTALG